jgi:predicted MPP superfamily phosphohydrolase
MIVFLFVILICGVSNLYMYFKLTHVLNTGTSGDITVFLLVLLMALLPVLINVYALRGAEKAVRTFAYLGFLWLGFLVLFFPVSVLLDIYNIAVEQMGQLFAKDFSSKVISSSAAFFIACIISIAVNAYGYFEAGNLRIERLTIKSPKLTPGSDNITVAQISDLHLGIIVSKRTLERVIQKLEGIKPDILVSTGDLVDGVVRQIGHIPEKLKTIPARLGKFAVTGNHEFYGKKTENLKFIEDAGFTLLRGRGITIGTKINIAGMDFTGGEARRKAVDQRPERDVLSEFPSDIFTILLKHRSDVEEQSLGLFDLQLSGHTHKGQIFPMSLATMFLFKYHTGYEKLPKGSAIYVSRGTGTAGPPVRFLSTPEITVIDIVAA